MAIEVDHWQREAAEIATALHDCLGGAVAFEAIAEAVDLELARYLHVPVVDFVPLLVERSVRARLRELGAG